MLLDGAKNPTRLLSRLLLCYFFPRVRTQLLALSKLGMSAALGQKRKSHDAVQESDLGQKNPAGAACKNFAPGTAIAPEMIAASSWVFATRLGT